MALTGDNVTDEQIVLFRALCVERNDYIMTAYCSLALGQTPRVALTATPYGARCRVARAITRAVRDA